MRKLICIIIVFIFIITLLTNIYSNDEIIKIRIIPNSNNETDLIIKEEVKEITKTYLNIIYDKDYNKFINNINNTKNILSNKLLDLGIENNISLSYHTLYNKTYNNNAVENEGSQVLYIVIGEGKGDNWWGIIYPELLQVSSESEYKYKSLFKELYILIKER